MRFSKDYPKLDERIFSTIRRSNGYEINQVVPISTPTRSFRAKVILKVRMKFNTIPEPFLQYDFGEKLPDYMIVDRICKLYHSHAPIPQDIMTIYFMEKVEDTG